MPENASTPRGATTIHNEASREERAYRESVWRANKCAPQATAAVVIACCETTLPSASRSRPSTLHQGLGYTRVVALLASFFVRTDRRRLCTGSDARDTADTVPKMKLSTLALLPAAASAFVPSVSNNVPLTSALSAVKTGPEGTPAGSKEEDLALTLEIIMNSMGSGVADEGSDDAAAPAAEEAPKKAKKAKKKKKSPPAEEPAMDVSKLDIRVGVIQEAWEHEEADKLFCEKIDIGEEEPRQIASGLRAYYNSEDLAGRRVCVLANLKARKLVGFPSHGMVLCASTEDGSSVVFVDPPADAAIGERVMCEGFDGEPATENQVGKKKILDKVFPDLKTNDSGVATYQGVPLTAGSGSCVAEGGLAGAQVS